MCFLEGSLVQHVAAIRACSPSSTSNSRTIDISQQFISQSCLDQTYHNFTSSYVCMCLCTLSDPLLDDLSGQLSLSFHSIERCCVTNTQSRSVKIKRVYHHLHTRVRFGVKLVTYPILARILKTHSLCFHFIHPTHTIRCKLYSSSQSSKNIENQLRSHSFSSFRSNITPPQPSYNKNGKH